jgi:hypothetical protein
MKKSILKLGCIIFFILAGCIGLGAQAKKTPSKKPVKKTAVKKKSKEKRTVGVIFNTDNIFMDLEEYQGGIGIKVRGEKLSFRTLFDFGFSSDTLDLGLGFTLEYHFKPGRVSPYLGGFIGGDIIRNWEEVDEDNYWSITTLPLSGGGIFGVEVFMLDFLSFFVEYNLKVSYSNMWTVESTAGVETTETESNFSIETGMGNSMKIGIIIYFDDVLKTSKK